MKTIQMIEINQPIGTFYVGKMSSTDIIHISKVSQRDGLKGHQRQLKEARAKEIATYCTDPDATFPTPIILAVAEDGFTPTESAVSGFVQFEYDETKKIAEILDGQHRIAGITAAAGKEFELPVVIMFNLREEQKAYVFSTINGNQTKVDRSLIYDLFDLSDTPSPYKTCHYIARSMNSDPQSPFYNRLKMLEKRESSKQTISQNTFVTNLCQLISGKPQEDAIALKKHVALKNNSQYVFRKYFIREKDEVILRILHNYFGAAADVFPTEWNNPKKFILTKAVGFEGLISALSTIVPRGEQKGDLSRPYFTRIFEQLKRQLDANGIQLTSDFFSSSSQDAKRLSRMIVDAEKHMDETRGWASPASY